MITDSFIFMWDFKDTIFFLFINVFSKIIDLSICPSWKIYSFNIWRHYSFIEHLSRLYYKIYYNVFKTIIIQMQPHVYMCCIVEQYPSFKNKNKIQYLLHVKTSKCWANFFWHSVYNIIFIGLSVSTSSSSFFIEIFEFKIP